MPSLKEQVIAFISECLEPEAEDSLLLQYLVRIQHQFNCIPDQAIDSLQQRLSSTDADIRSVIEFYSFLNFESDIRYRFLFSDNITDRFSGNQKYYQQLKSGLEGDKADVQFTSCTGLCDQGPGLIVNGQAISRLDKDRVDRIVEMVKADKPLDQWPDEWFLIEDNVHRPDLQLACDYQPGAGLRSVLEQGANGFLQLMQTAGLRGRGGAGFPTASKWSFCRQADADRRYVVCNADEGEPGTFKDRVLLNRNAEAVIEGMTICARVIDARRGFIYLRGEYRFLMDKLQAVIDQRRQQGLLGKSILGQAGFDFDITIHLGAGAYICGEESALIESLEGKRGVPRIRPPFPVQQGFLGKPTVVNNVETFFSVNHIAAHGANDFKNLGTEQSRGTRLLSISGDCDNPGVYEYPFGVSLHQILKDCGGSNAQAIQMAGAAGHTVLAKDFDRCMSFEDLPTGGSFMVIGPERNLIEVLENFAAFFQHESCGFCTTCRVGTRLIAEIIERFSQGHGSAQDLQHLEAITKLMQQGSFCGLGTSAATAFIDALRDNRNLFTPQATDDVNPVFDLQQATSDFDRLTARFRQEG